MSAERVICVLQGPSSYFFDLLGDALRSRGADAFRICFCLGDRIFWRRKPLIWSQDSLTAWPKAFEALIRERGVTDVVMLGDSRPRHRAAAVIARKLGVKAHIVEHGYFRPDWLTHEIGGMSARSEFRARLERGEITLDAYPPESDPPSAEKQFQSSFASYAAMDVAYNLSNVLSGPFVAPRYRGHSNVWPLVEYAGWLRKLIISSRRRQRAEERLASLLRSGAPYFLWALQLESDYQIRVDGLGAPQAELVPRILRSFAAHAPNEAQLLVKLHPLDNLWLDWEGRLRSAAKAAGLDAKRIIVIDGGDLDRAIRGADGVFSVNSTVGLRAIALGARTKALGPALYDRPELTHPGGLESLDGFWRRSHRPDPKFASRFLAALRHETQFRGAFDGEGAAPGAETLASRILQ